MQPLYVTNAGGLKFFNLLIAAITLVDVLIVAGLLVAGATAWISVLFFSSALPAAIVWLVLPRRFEVWRDQLVLVFPVVARWSIPFDTIESAQAAKWWHAYAFMGVRFASNPGQAVDIMRRKSNVFTRPNIVISPANREEFLDRFNEALQRYRDA